MTRPTIKSIAKRTGFSVGTVSNALRGSDSVRPETRDQIQKVAAELGYRVNLDALKLKTRKSYRIAVLVSVVSEPQGEWEGVEFTRIVAGISEALSGSRYELSVFSVSSLNDAMATLERIVTTGLADGVIFSGTLVNDPRIAFLQDREFPFVTYGMSEGCAPHPFVDFDSELAAYDATSRLLALGHRRIALVNPPPRLIYARQRQAGYVDAFRSAGLAHDPDLIISGPTTAQMGRNAFDQIMAHSTRPTACICSNEAQTLGILSAAAEAGVRVGPEFTVISADDLLLSQYFVPAPSTYYVPIEQTSRLLGELMLKCLDGADTAQTQQKIRAKLIARQPDRPAPAEALEP